MRPAPHPSAWRNASQRLPSELSPGSDIPSNPYSRDSYRKEWRFYPRLFAPPCPYLPPPFCRRVRRLGRIWTSRT